MSLPIQEKVKELSVVTASIDVDSLKKISSLSSAASSALNVGNIVCEFVETIDDIATAVTDLVSDIGSAIEGLSEDVTKMLAKFKFPAGFDMSKMLDGVPGLDDIKEFLEKKLEDIGELLKDPIGSLVSALDDALDRITGVLNLIGSEVAKAITSAMKAAAELIDDLREILKTGVQFPNLKKIIDGLKPECLTNPTQIAKLQKELESVSTTLDNPTVVSQVVKEQNQGAILTKPKSVTVTSDLAKATGTLVLKSKTALINGVTVAKFMDGYNSTSFKNYMKSVESSGGDVEAVSNTLHDNLYKQAQVLQFVKNSSLFDKSSVEVTIGVNIDHPDEDRTNGKKISYIIQNPQSNTSADLEGTQLLAQELATKFPYADEIELEHFKDPVTKEYKTMVTVTVSEKKVKIPKVKTKKDGEVVSGGELQTLAGETIKKKSFEELQKEFLELSETIKERHSIWTSSDFENSIEADAYQQETNNLRRKRKLIDIQLKNMVV